MVYISPYVTHAEDLRALINRTERNYNIPKDLLVSIAKIESGVRPYALNVRGKSLFAKSVQDAKDIIQFNLDSGVTNIDVGVMQVNYRWHGGKFPNIDEMLNPSKNIEYAARLLTELYKFHGSWTKAIRFYHSSNPEFHKKYSRKIIITWLNS